MIETVTKIIEAFFKVFEIASERGYPVDNICLYARSEILKELGLKDKLEIRVHKENFHFEYDLKIVSDNTIWKTNYENGQYQSDIYIVNPDWEITEHSVPFMICQVSKILIDKE